MIDEEDPLSAAEPVSRREALAGLGILASLVSALAGVVAYRVVDEGRQRQTGSSARGVGWAARSVSPDPIRDQATAPAAYLAPATALTEPTRSSAPRFVAPGGASSSSSAARGEPTAAPIE